MVTMSNKHGTYELRNDLRLTIRKIGIEIRK